MQNEFTLGICKHLQIYLQICKRVYRICKCREFFLPVCMYHTVHVLLCTSKTKQLSQSGCCCCIYCFLNLFLLSPYYYYYCCFPFFVDTCIIVSNLSIYQTINHHQWIACKIINMHPSMDQEMVSMLLLLSLFYVVSIFVLLLFFLNWKKRPQLIGYHPVQKLHRSLCKKNQQ